MKKLVCVLVFAGSLVGQSFHIIRVIPSGGSTGEIDLQGDTSHPTSVVRLVPDSTGTQLEYRGAGSGGVGPLQITDAANVPCLSLNSTIAAVKTFEASWCAGSTAAFAVFNAGHTLDFEINQAGDTMTKNIAFMADNLYTVGSLTTSPSVIYTHILHTPLVEVDTINVNLALNLMTHTTVLDFAGGIQESSPFLNDIYWINHTGTQVMRLVGDNGTLGNFLSVSGSVFAKASASVIGGAGTLTVNALAGQSQDLMDVIDSSSTTMLSVKPDGETLLDVATASGMSSLEVVQHTASSFGIFGLALGSGSEAILGRADGANSVAVYAFDNSGSSGSFGLYAQSSAGTAARFDGTSVGTVGAVKITDSANAPCLSLYSSVTTIEGTWCSGSTAAFAVINNAGSQVFNVIQNGDVNVTGALSVSGNTTVHNIIFGADNTYTVGSIAVSPSVIYSHIFHGPLAELVQVNVATQIEMQGTTANIDFNAGLNMTAPALNKILWTNSGATTIMTLTGDNGTLGNFLSVAGSVFMKTSASVIGGTGTLTVEALTSQAQNLADFYDASLNKVLTISPTGITKIMASSSGVTGAFQIIDGAGAPCVSMYSTGPTFDSSWCSGSTAAFAVINNSSSVVFTISQTSGNLFTNGAISGTHLQNLGTSDSPTFSVPTATGYLGGSIAIGTNNGTLATSGSGGTISNTGSTIGMVVYDSAGHCNIGTGSFACSSDERLKDHIATVGDGIDLIRALRPVTFHWRTNGEFTQGFIAQEVQAILPNLVTADAAGYLELNQIGMIPYLVRAVQQLEAEVNSLKTGH